MALVTAAWALVMNAWLVYVAPLTVAMLPDCAEMTRDLRVGTAPAVMLVDSLLVLVVEAATLVILPPDTVTDTATEPYLCVTVPPEYVPSLSPLAGVVVVALVAGAVVAGTVALVVVPAAEVTPPAVVPALVAAAVVPGFEVVVVALGAPGVDAAGSPVVVEASSGVEESVALALAAALVSVVPARAEVVPCWPA